MKTPQEKIVLLTPKLLKVIKKALPQIRSRYVAIELKDIAVKLAIEIKQIEQQSKLNNKLKGKHSSMKNHGNVGESNQSDI